ncbi:MAG: adenylate/guanylate cyclase domain-containing protein [Pseudomonadota bacterium]
MNANVTADEMTAGATDASGSGGRTNFRSERILWGLAAIALSALIAIACFRGVPQLSSLETTINDMQRVMIAPRSEQDKRISVVAFDEKTLTQFPYRSPVDRAFLADLIDALGEAGAKAIVFDVIFDQPTEVEKDEALIDALRRFPGPVVAAWGDQQAGFTAEQSAYILEFAARAEIDLGFAHLVIDDDGIVRRFATRLDGIPKLSMPGVMAKANTGEEPMVTGVIDWFQPSEVGKTLFQQLPAMRVVQFAERDATLNVLKNALGDRIVMIGADLEQRDRHQTSLGVDPRNTRTIPGVVIQAFVLSQLLDGRVVPNASPTVIYALVIAVATIGVTVGLSRWNLGWKALAVVSMLVAYLTIVFFMARAGTYFMPVAPVVAAIFMSFLLAISLDSFLTQRNERFIRLAFSHYLEPAMVDQLADDPQALRLGGDRREMSIIFTDIQGFTTMSEELPPDQLTRLLNDYFDGMSDIIIAHGGAIDKFIGDAVVAHFGAPTPMADHALRALQCAGELDKFGERFRRKNAHLGLGVTRIGVHTGTATVGNFGGRARFDYTAMGDTVNTASRLESSNKRYGTRVGVSQETAEAANALASREDKLPLLQTIGQIMLKGKTKPVTVYTVNNDADEEFVWAYEAAFSMIEVDLAKARTALEELSRANPNDPLVRWHLQRFERGDTGTMIGAA